MLRQAIFQAAVVHTSEGDLIGQPFILRMILRIEPYRRSAVGLDSENADDLDLMKAPVVDRVGVLGGPHGSRRQPIWREFTIDCGGHRFPVLEDAAENLPEAAAVEVAVGLGLGRLKDQKLDAMRAASKDPEIVYRWIELHGCASP